MNYIGSIVRIMETPKLDHINKNISRTEFRVQLPKIRNKKSVTIVNLVFWGDFASDVANYYRINDYILIEGYLAFKKKRGSKLVKETLKYLEITVFKIYPLFLEGEPKSIKLEELK